MKMILNTFLVFSLFLMVVVVDGQGGARVGFYSRSCPSAETIIRSTVRSHFQSNPLIAPGLLRIHFHDCFVRGCDASILIQGTSTELTTPPNSNLRGFEVIDDAKTQLEAICPGIVSCADILTLATRDAVVMTGGLRWEVPTGRRDGTVSLASETANLPGFRDPVAVQAKQFSDLGLNLQDLVALAGGHTIGTASCVVFSYRLYNFNSTGGPDPSINPSFLPSLRTMCPQNGNGQVRVGLDNGSPANFDTSYFMNLRNNRGVLESDQFLWTDPSTRPIVQGFLGTKGVRPLRFGLEFGRSMVKMGNIQLKTGTQGEIRKVCSRIN
ncbi:peroxidase N1-like [Impatiens glandulifera]|uniref:peroxidase N1-like n=1 Tax=Impatiens glandulifera TaxID=253017 RepID=UPI001FB0DA59|nr:peroxidase N1-like [Impatiens glandulifera]